MMKKKLGVYKKENLKNSFHVPCSCMNQNITASNIIMISSRNEENALLYWYTTSCLTEESELP